MAALKLVDPSIKLILCGLNGTADWDRYVLQECVDVIDMHSIHLYTYSHEYAGCPSLVYIPFTWPSC